MNDQAPTQAQAQAVEPICKLNELFAMQTKLNNYVFASKNITDHDGQILTMATIMRDAQEHGDELTARSLSVEWQQRYNNALAAETKEVDDEIPKKFWSDRTADLNNIQEEIVDQLHFWISMALSSGMNADAVFRKYKEKNAVNFKRMDENYVERF
jgi:dimeric dUTPase (all-alpha-NTP-PPase superfamily)